MSSTQNQLWFQKRPIPIFIITAVCVFQFYGISIFMLENWTEFIELVKTGAISPLNFAVKLLYPTILFIAGLLLFFFRKLSIYFFGFYLIWGLIKIITENPDFQAYGSLAMSFGIVVYCLRLNAQGMLK